jgi:hypothetical protein
VLDGAAFESVAGGNDLYVDFRLYLEDDLLVKVDRASMACSLEMRTPFLDHRLIEFAAGLPADLKVRGFELKYLLKKAAEKWLPRKIVYRQKRGFSVPISRWMRKGIAFLGWMRPSEEERLRAPRAVQRFRSCAGFSQNTGASGPTTGKYSGPSSVSSFGTIGGHSSGALPALTVTPENQPSPLGRGCPAPAL